MKPLHLVKRFFGALWPGEPSPVDEAWVEQVLTSEELLLYRRLPNHDRRHAIRCGRKAEQLFGDDVESRWLAAAILHDVGKYDSDFSVPGRAVATVVAPLWGEKPLVRWREKPGLRRRIALYAAHSELGAEQIRRAGGREEAAQWAEAHHRPDLWGRIDIPADAIRKLLVSDGEAGAPAGLG
jgi:hypothetical protein